MEKDNSNIKCIPLKNHRYGCSLSNIYYGTVAFLISKSDILKDKKANAYSFVEPELKYNCIYFLIGHELDEQNNSVEMVYVGQAGIRDNNQSVLDRLNEHVWLDKDPIKYRDKWTDIVVITNEKGAWGSTELDALECLFWNLISVGNRYNTTKPSGKGINTEKYVDAINQIKNYMNYLGFTVFGNMTKESIASDVKKIAQAKSDKSVDLDRGTSKIPNITTPENIVNNMLDMLPDSVWNDETVFLDPACKGGEYLKAIYNRLINNKELLRKYDDNVDALKFHILSKQLFGIALNQNSRAEAIKKLNGFDYNIRVIPNYIELLKLTDSLERKNIDTKKMWQEELKKEFGEEMKFNVVIGNPPYQEKVGGGLNDSGAKAIFDRFMSMGIDVGDIVSMITPTKWIAGNQKNFVNIRNKMISGNHLVKMIDYFNSTLLFPDAQIAGGVSYYVYDKNYIGNTEFTSVINKTYNGIRDLNKEGIIPRFEYGDNVINKIRQVDKLFLDKFVSKDYWGLPTNFNEGRKERTSDNEIEVITPRGSYFVNKSNVFDVKDYEHYKVKFTRAVNGSTFLLDGKKTILSSISIMKPNQICNASYMVINGIKTLEQAENLKKYLQTKFVRFLILQTLFGIGLTSDRFIFVPLLDFSRQWTDEELYKRYSLTEDEISFIEDNIKALDEE